jgi:3-isopropylmalate dehydrogenase
MPDAIGLDGLIPGWKSPEPRNRYLVGVLPGEGIGPEIIDVALKILEECARGAGVDFQVRTGGDIGLKALRNHGRILTPEVEAFCRSIFAEGGALLCGPAGGRFVYDLRARFGLYCKISPIRPLKPLYDTGVLKPEALAEVDFLVVRENTGGVYFGKWKERGQGRNRTASHSFRYREDEVEQIIKVAAGLAARRRRDLALVTKSEGLPSISRLWADVASEIAAAAGLRFRILQVDHAAFQLVHTGRRFDVVVSSNLFGDILSDCCGLLLGSRGMCFSGNMGKDSRAVYQTGHGGANDLVGQNQANPVGQILSLGLMLEVSFGLGGMASAIRRAVEVTLGEGWRTPDIAGPDSSVIGTRELGQKIAQNLQELKR